MVSFALSERVIDRVNRRLPGDDQCVRDAFRALIGRDPGLSQSAQRASVRPKIARCLVQNSSYDRTRTGCGIASRIPALARRRRASLKKA